MLIIGRLSIDNNHYISGVAATLTGYLVNATTSHWTEMEKEEKVLHLRC